MHAEAAQGRRLGRELHDRVGSNISAMLLTVALVRKEMDTAPAAGPSSRLGALEEMLNTTMQHVRDLLSDLRPTGLDELGLVAALRHHAALLSARSEVEFIVSGREFSPRLDPDCEMAFFRIAQEAWTNALKHAHATRVVLTLTSTRRRVLMQVQDDGRGFLPAAGKIPTLGLTTMRERAQAIGATLNVAHSTGAGVRLDLILPRPATGAG
jgi:signal transduction histidine kinase